MGYKIIPLTTSPDQRFLCTIPVDGKNIMLSFQIRYNTEAGYWWMSVSQNGAMLIDSLPIQYSDYPAADLLGQYSYLEIGSAFLCKTSALPSDTPNDSNLGTEYVLLWGDTVE